MKNLDGPPKNASNPYVLERLLHNCIECACCGSVSHFKAEYRKGLSIQVNIAGRVMAVRRAVYMAAFPEKQIQKNRRITSKCHNPNCINAELLVQATAGQIIKADYEKGLRDRAAVTAHLARYTRELNMKLSDESVLHILVDTRGGTEGAKDYGISPEHFNAIKRGASRRVRNPFAGLMA
jgi:hypothetical protein